MSHLDPRRFLASNTALAGSLVLILLVTLTPTHAHHEVHLRPLQDVLGAFEPTLNLQRMLGVIGNVALFAPLGAVLRARGVELGQATARGLALSFAIELTQLGIPGRTTSVDDVLLNTVGVVLGYLLVARWSSRSTHA
jgi:glycopeptide antibiotics resistance protein